MSSTPSRKRTRRARLVETKRARTQDDPTSLYRPVTVNATFQTLPEEMQVMILAHITSDDISSLGKVSKRWLAFTKSNSFWRLLWRQQGGTFGPIDIPVRIFTSKKAGQMLRTLFTKDLLTRNFVTNDIKNNILLDWDLGPGVTHWYDVSQSKRVFLLPPGGKITQDILLRKHGVYPTLLKHLGPIQFVTRAKFRFPPDAVGGSDIIMLGLSQIWHRRIARFESMENIDTDSDGWKTAQIEYETLGSSFKTSRQNELLLHILNMGSNQLAIEVAEIAVTLKIIAVETLPQKPEFGYGFKESTFRSMDNAHI